MEVLVKPISAEMQVHDCDAGGGGCTFQCGTFIVR